MLNFPSVWALLLSVYDLVSFLLHCFSCLIAWWLVEKAFVMGVLGLDPMISRALTNFSISKALSLVLC